MNNNYRGDYNNAYVFRLANFAQLFVKSGIISAIQFVSGDDYAIPYYY
mgnify:CR=1 FL=1